jgi:cytochrome c biogenesis protein CcdA
MSELLIAAGSALWLGILTSISPCPLATNIAAITYIGRQVGRPGQVILTGMVYTLGRSLVYVGVGALVVGSVLAVPKLSFFLQENFNKFLGPILLLTGLVLLDLLKFRTSGPTISHNMQERVAGYGVWGGGLLGMLFALSFCPISAALFFGSLIPLAVQHRSYVLMPTVYGIGTALPVVGFAIIIAVGARYLGDIFNRLAVFERWARRVTGAIFIVVGLYYIATYLFGVQFF